MGRPIDEVIGCRWCTIKGDEMAKGARAGTPNCPFKKKVNKKHRGSRGDEGVLIGPGLGRRRIFTDFRLLITPKFVKILLPTPNKKFYFIAIRKYIIPFCAIYCYFNSLNANNKYRNMFI